MKIKNENICLYLKKSIMYKDLITQIIKYLKPKEEYYLKLDILLIREYVFFVFYLIYEVNCEIRIKNIIHISDSHINFGEYARFLIKYLPNNNYILYKIGTSESDWCNGGMVYLYIDMKKNYLHICIPPSFFFEESNLEDLVEKMESFNSFVSIYDPRYCKRNERIESYKLNKGSIKSIYKGYKCFEKISKIIDISELRKYQLNDEDKRYIRIITNDC